jgi:hypothetical protein
MIDFWGETRLSKCHKCVLWMGWCNEEWSWKSLPPRHHRLNDWCSPKDIKLFSLELVKLTLFVLMLLRGESNHRLSRMLLSPVPRMVKRKAPRLGIWPSGQLGLPGIQETLSWIPSSALTRPSGAGLTFGDGSRESEIQSHYWLKGVFKANLEWMRLIHTKRQRQTHTHRDRLRQK